LHLNIDYVGSSGVILTPEQKAALQTSLVVLRSEQKFNKVLFLGKVKGIKEDYFLAVGLNNDAMTDRKHLYSTDCVTWVVLPDATQEMKDKARAARGRFTGDPSNEFEYTETKRVQGEGDEVIEEDETINIKEEDRLAAVLAEINHDVAIAPRGAFMLTPSGQVVPNRSFEGLTVAEAAKLSSYVHFRPAEILPTKSLLDRANLDRSLDFMDSIEEDIPRGCWSLQLDRGSGLVILKSLLWLGYVFYLVPGTSKFGSVYFGIGERNCDLPFML